MAGEAFEAVLVAELHLFRIPVLIGGGMPALSLDDGRVALELLDERRFGNGTVHLHDRTGT